MKTRLSALFLLIALNLPWAVFSQVALKQIQATATKPLTPDDIVQVTGVGDIRLSPSGKQVLGVISSVCPVRNENTDSLVLINLETRQQEILSAGYSPCWSPDGNEFAFESPEGEVCIFDLMTKQQRRLARIGYSDYFMGHRVVKRLAWSPDGRYIAYISTLPQTSEDTADPNVKVIDRLLYKTKGGRGRPHYTDDHLSHIWIIPASGGEPLLITPGNFNEHSLAWGSNSRTILFISNRTGDPDNNQFYDLWSVDIHTLEITRLTNMFGTVVQAAGSPDGSQVAFLATTGRIATNDSPAEHSHLYIMPSGGGTPACLTCPFDRNIENISWSGNGEFIFFTAGDRGRTSLYRVSHRTGMVETVITGDFCLHEYSASPNGNHIVFTRSSVTRPVELYQFSGPEQNRQITTLNQPLLERCRLAEADPIWFRSFDGTMVQGWIMKPPFFNASEKCPLLLVIHGGPHNMYGYNFDEKLQILASAGYAVLFINPRGSFGYGQAFASGCVMNWGGGDYHDLMAGVDYALDKFPWIDKERLGVTGQSYGGFMTNWIITQTSRFRAAVSEGGLSNLISFAGTSLYHSLMESEFNGIAYNNFPLLWQWSPLRNVRNVTTPTLFMHGETDNEVPLSQAEEMFIALKKLGVETRLVIYRGEGHGWRPDMLPVNKKDAYLRMTDWFDRYLKAGGQGN